MSSQIILFTVFLALIGFSAQALAHAPEKRCGWYVVTAPGNSLLIDNDSQWVLSPGADIKIDDPKWAGFKRTKDNWVSTKSDQGYACVCAHLDTDHGHHIVKEIVGIDINPLSQCRADPIIKPLEPTTK